MDRQAILDEIIEYDSPARLRPGEFTIYDYIERRKARGAMPVAYNTSVRYLNRLVERGVLKVRRVLDVGRWKNAYSLEEHHGREKERETEEKGEI